MKHCEAIGAPYFFVWTYKPKHKDIYEHYMHVVWWKERNKAFGEFFEYCLN